MALPDKVRQLLKQRGLSFKHFALSESMLRQDHEDEAPYIAQWNVAVLGPAPTLVDGFTEEELSRIDLDASFPPIDPRLLDEATREQAFTADSDRAQFIEQLRTATPLQIRAYIQNNVTDLASARAMLVRLALAVALIVRQ